MKTRSRDLLSDPEYSEKLQSDNEVNRETSEHSEERLFNLECQLGELECENINIRAECKRSKDHATTLESSIFKLKGENQELQESYQRYGDYASTLECKIGELKREGLELQEDVEHIEEYANTLECNVHELECEKAELQDRYEEIKDTSDRVQHDLVDSLAKVERLEMTIEKQNEEFAKINAESEAKHKISTGLHPKLEDTISNASQPHAEEVKYSDERHITRVTTPAKNVSKTFESLAGILVLVAVSASWWWA